MDPLLAPWPVGLAPDGPLSFPFFPPALPFPASGGPADVVAAPASPPPYLERGNEREPTPARLVRITEKLSEIVNDLIRNGALVRTASGWDVRPRRHQYTRSPNAGDDDRVGAAAGDLWIDANGVAVYCCVSAARGAAAWVLLGVGT